PASNESIPALRNPARSKTRRGPVVRQRRLRLGLAGRAAAVEALRTRGHASGIRFGVICDGDVSEGGNEAWVAQALQRCRQVVASPRIRPDDLLAQTWEPSPTKMLPESDPGALTFEALRLETMRGDRQAR